VKEPDQLIGNREELLNQRKDMVAKLRATLQVFQSNAVQILTSQNFESKDARVSDAEVGQGEGNKNRNEDTVHGNTAQVELEDTHALEAAPTRKRSLDGSFRGQ
jgi:hypothetical protein